MIALDFSINTNSFPLPYHVYKDLTDRFIELATKYIAPQEHPAKAKLASFLDVSSDALCITAGASESIFSIPRLFRATSSLIFPPTFWEYRAALQAVGSQVIPVFRSPQDNFRFPSDVAQLPVADITFVANPDNPTSLLIDTDYLLKLSQHQHGALLVIDETYLLFRKDFMERTMMQQAAASKNMIVVASLSKFFNIPGLRAGYAVGHPDNMETLRNALVPFSVNNIALYIIQRMLDEAEFISDARSILEGERLRVTQILRSIPGFDPIPAEANFILVRVNPGTGKDLENWLASTSIRLRWGEELEALTSDYFRMCVRKPEHNAVLLDQLRAFAARPMEPMPT